MLGNTSSPFGQKPAAPGGFGTSLTQPTFGSPGTSAFGAPQQSTFGQGSTFGQAVPAPTFGHPSATPAFGQANNSSVFGQGTSAPGFGTSSQPAFGTPSAQPAFGTSATQSAFGTTPNQPTFGTPSAQATFGTPTSTPAFGASSNTPAFGSSATPAFGAATTTPAFGAQSTTPAFGIPTTTAGFGTSTTTPAFGSSTTPLSFGSNQQKTGFGTATTSLSFGTGTLSAPTTTQTSSFQFGTNSGQTTIASATPTIGATTVQSSFSAPQTTSSLSFGLSKPGTVSFSTPVTTTTTTTQSSLTFGSSLTSKPSTIPGSSGFSFGTLGATQTTTPSTTIQSVSVSSGLSNFISTGSSFGTALGGKSMLTITGNTATPLYSAKTADLQAGRSAGQIPPKCQNVPTAVLELVESFKNNIKEQKHLCLEVSRASLKPISKISNDAENIKRSVMKLERAVNKNKLFNTKLKDETVKALANVEIAQKAVDIPGGFPSDNSIITDYFIQLANKFQQQVLALRVELESTEKSILCELNPVAFTPQELSTTMQRLYECFVALAGRFQFVHAQISNLKVQHLELRRKKFEDFTDIFSKKNNVNASKPVIQNVLSSGPVPFQGIRTISSVMSSMGYPMKNNITSSFSTANPTNTSLFGITMNQSLQNNSLSATSPQSIPGSKRGKR